MQILTMTPEQTIIRSAEDARRWQEETLPQLRNEARALMLKGQESVIIRTAHGDVADVVEPGPEDVRDWCGCDACHRVLDDMRESYR